MIALQRHQLEAYLDHELEILDPNNGIVFLTESNIDQAIDEQWMPLLLDPDKDINDSLIHNGETIDDPYEYLESINPVTEEKKLTELPDMPEEVEYEYLAMHFDKFSLVGRGLALNKKEWI